MKHALALLLALLLFTSGAVAQITVDGDLSDWDSAWVNDDPDSDAPATCDTEILDWGFYYASQTASDPGYIYWYCRLDTDISAYSSAYPGLWIDVDHYVGPTTFIWDMYRMKPNGLTGYLNTYQAPSLSTLASDWAGPEWLDAGTLIHGPDILAELGYNDEGYNYWGGNTKLESWVSGSYKKTLDCIGIQGNVCNGTVATAGTVFEGQVPIDDLVDETKRLEDYNNGGFRGGDISGQWKVSMRSAGWKLVGPSGWDVDVTVPITFAIFADGDNDGDCDIADYGKIEVNFGRTSMSWEEGNYADNNDNDKVDLADYGFLQRTYGMDIDSLGPVTAVPTPEPLTLALLGLGGLFLRRKS